jgi:hypothetical protein
MPKHCWYCKSIVDKPDDFLGDFNCEKCGVMNSWYPPIEIQNTNTEVNMIDYNSEKYAGKYVYLPKVGDQAEFELKEIREVPCNNPKLNFSEKVVVMANGIPVTDDDGEPAYKIKDLGYHVEAVLGNGKILSITNMSAFIKVFKTHDIRDGDRVLIQHLDKATWKVTKL